MAEKLIDEKDYAGARAILNSVDDPTARELERKIDAMQPQSRRWTVHPLIPLIAFTIGGLAVLVTLISFVDPNMDYSLRSVAGILAIVGLVIAYVTNKLNKR